MVGAGTSAVAGGVASDTTGGAARVVVGVVALSLGLALHDTSGVIGGLAD